MSGAGTPNPDELYRLLRREMRRARELERRLNEIENSRFFRLLRWPGRAVPAWKGRLGQWLLRSPLHPLYLKLARPVDRYQEWLLREDTTVPLVEGPLISVVVPVHNQRHEWLEEAVESVAGQTYGNWQLCLCDDGSSDAWIAEYLTKRAAADARISFVRAPERGGIARAANQAAALARGEYLAFLDSDDVLAPHALAAMAGAIAGAGADLLYSDEDKLDGAGLRVEPYFRPAWSPDLLLSCMYMGHLLCLRRELFERVGRLRVECDGSQDFDLALRASEVATRVEHVPRVLYHWRRHGASTASGSAARPHTHAAGKRAVEAALGRRGEAGTVEDGPIANSYRVRRRVLGEPLVSIVICSRDEQLLSACLRAIQAQTAYSRREVIVVQHGWAGESAGWRGVPWRGAFNFAAMNNAAARAAGGEVLVFLNDDAAPLDAGWLEALVAQAQRKGVGVAGARLLYGNGAFQHAGMALEATAGTVHPHRDRFGAEQWPWLAYAREVTAVTGACMAVRRGVFAELGGFDEAFPVNFNDADLCLRAWRAGYRVIYEPAALLRHDECRSRTPGILFDELDAFEARWGREMEAGDPYFPAPH